MRSSETVAIVYYLYLTVVAMIRVGQEGPRVFATLGARCTAAAVIAGISAPLLPGLVRDWTPAVLLLVGYWLSGAFFQQPMTTIESRLLASDRALFERLDLDATLERAPRVVLEGLELSYLCVTPLVPAAFATILCIGGEASTDRFWTCVLLAGFVCYGALPWIQTRPPRAIEGPGAMDRRALHVRAINGRVLDAASVRVNTLPSGHAAVAVAAAIGVLELSPALGAPFAVLAGLISIAAVVGRYHYAVDVALGILVAVLARAAVAWL